MEPNILSGQTATCIKTAKMSSGNYAGLIAFTKGKNYECNDDGYFTDDLGQKHGVMGGDDFFKKHFKIIIQTPKTETPTSFTISAFQLTHMHSCFEEMSKREMVTYSESEMKARNHANSVQFNSFKILFREQLQALGLNVDVEY